MAHIDASRAYFYAPSRRLTFVMRRRPCALCHAECKSVRHTGRAEELGAQVLARAQGNGVQERPCQPNIVAQGMGSEAGGPRRCLLLCRTRSSIGDFRRCNAEYLRGCKHRTQGRSTEGSGYVEWKDQMDSKVTWEADPRHVMDHEGVAPQGSCKDAQRQLTTGEENGPSDDDVESADEAKQHKCVGAPANYLGLDRPDFQFTSRALCKRVSKPMKGDFEHVKRLGRLLRFIRGRCARTHGSTTCQK